MCIPRSRNGCLLPTNVSIGPAAACRFNDGLISVFRPVWGLSFGAGAEEARDRTKTGGRSALVQEGGRPPSYNIPGRKEGRTEIKKETIKESMSGLGRTSHPFPGCRHLNRIKLVAEGRKICYEDSHPEL